LKERIFSRSLAMTEIFVPVGIIGLCLIVAAVCGWSAHTKRRLNEVLKFCAIERVIGLEADGSENTFYFVRIGEYFRTAPSKEAFSKMLDCLKVLGLKPASLEVYRKVLDAHPCVSWHYEPNEGARVVIGAATEYGEGYSRIIGYRDALKPGEFRFGDWVLCEDLPRSVPSFRYCDAQDFRPKKASTFRTAI
jgi:hypothetical protein